MHPSGYRCSPCRWAWFSLSFCHRFQDYVKPRHIWDRPRIYVGDFSSSNQQLPPRDYLLLGCYVRVRNWLFVINDGETLSLVVVAVMHDRTMLFSNHLQIVGQLQKPRNRRKTWAWLYLTCSFGYLSALTKGGKKRKENQNLLQNIT